MSCNGCRVLRKGCSDDCTLRPCLEWIKSPDSQANATLFLAKFYGRAGLISLISAGPSHQRPAIFKSLFYEACGRIIDPVYGSAGLMSTGNWPRCQAAVEAVLNGAPLMIPSSSKDDEASSNQGQYPILPLERCDIRHLSKDSAPSLHRVKTRNVSKSRVDSLAAELMCDSETKFTITGWDVGEDEKGFVKELNRESSHNSFSEKELVNREEQLVCGVGPEPYLSDIDLELTLGLNPMLQNYVYSDLVLNLTTMKMELKKVAKFNHISSNEVGLVYLLMV